MTSHIFLCHSECHGLKKLHLRTILCSTAHHTYMWSRQQCAWCKVMKELQNGKVPLGSRSSRQTFRGRKDPKQLDMFNISEILNPHSQETQIRNTKSKSQIHNIRFLIAAISNIFPFFRWPWKAASCAGVAPFKALARKVSGTKARSSSKVSTSQAGYGFDDNCVSRILGVSVICW